MNIFEVKVGEFEGLYRSIAPSKSKAEDSLQECTIRRYNYVLISEDQKTLTVFTTKRRYSFEKPGGNKFTEDEVSKLNDALPVSGKLKHSMVIDAVFDVFPSEDALLFSALEGVDTIWKTRVVPDQQFWPYGVSENFLLRNVRLERDFNFYGKKLCIEDSSFLGRCRIRLHKVKELSMVDCQFPEAEQQEDSTLYLEGEVEKFLIAGASTLYGAECVIDQRRLRLRDSEGHPTQIEFRASRELKRHLLDNDEIESGFDVSLFREESIQGVVDYIREKEGKLQNAQLRKFEKGFDREQRKIENAFKIMAYAEKAILKLKELKTKDNFIARGLYSVAKQAAPLLLRVKSYAHDKLDEAGEELVFIEHQRRIISGAESAACLGVAYDEDGLRFIYDELNPEEDKNTVNCEFDPVECVRELVGDGASERLIDYTTEYLDNMKDMLVALMDVESRKMRDLGDNRNLPGEIRHLLGKEKVKSNHLVME